MKLPAHFIALLLSLGSLHAAAAEVALIGVLGNRAAVLALDGGDPKTVKVGQTWNGITVVSVAKDRATVRVEGKERVLVQGPHYRGAAAPSSREATTLAADARGHYFADGMVNGVGVRFVVDTGASVVALPGDDAKRLGIDYRAGRRGRIKTANGEVDSFRIQLDTVKVGGIELANVDAVVIEKGLDVALLGMTFLSRVEMRNDGQTMTLIRRF